MATAGEVPWLDSRYWEVEDDEAVPQVASDRRGVVGVDGEMAKKARFCRVETLSVACRGREEGAGG
jgi:hypothetical protein